MKLTELRNYYNHWHSSHKSEALDKRSLNFYKSVISELFNYKKASNKTRLLDIACGTCDFLSVVDNTEIKTYGVDISDSAIKSGKQKTKALLKRGSAEKLPFQANYFDYITCFGSLEHFSNQKKSVSEIARTLSKNGVCFIQVPNLMFLGHIYMALRYGVMPSEGGQEFSENYYTHGGWVKLLEENGLKVIRTDKFNEVYATKKVNTLVVFLWQNLLKHFIPLYCSYAFNFYCKKK